jgi:hypothetical protein
MGPRLAMHGLGVCRERTTDAQSMRIRFWPSSLLRRAKVLIGLVLISGTAFAQSASIATLDDSPLRSGAVNTAPDRLGSAGPRAVGASPSAPPEAPGRHKFWDGENRLLFATVAALSAADFAITRANLQRGGKELDPVTRVFSGTTAGLATNFAGETAGIIGLSYFFHKTGHHRLERITPLLNIGASSFAVLYDLSHR